MLQLIGKAQTLKFFLQQELQQALELPNYLSMLKLDFIIQIDLYMMTMTTIHYYLQPYFHTISISKKTCLFNHLWGKFLAYGFDEADIDGGWRMGVGFNNKHFYVNCGYDYSFNYGVDEDALFVSVGYNF